MKPFAISLPSFGLLLASRSPIPSKIDEGRERRGKRREKPESSRRSSDEQSKDLTYDTTIYPKILKAMLILDVPTL
jgi:hypothetical protein